MAKNEWDVVSQTPIQRSAQDEWSVVSQTPIADTSQEGPGFLTRTADYLKQFIAPVVSAPFTAPQALEQAARGAARPAMEGTPEAIMPSSVYQPGLDTEEALFGPETEKQKAQRKLGAQRALADIPSLPGAKALADYGHKVQKDIQESVSEQSKKAMQESEITGNIFKGQVDFGKNPTVHGYLLQAANVFGSLAPVIATSMVTKSPTAGAVVGGTMAADEAAGNAVEYIDKLSHEELLKTSPMYADLIMGGASEEEARNLITRKAAETGAALQGIVATFGDHLTGKLVTGAFDDLLTKAAGKSVLRKTAVGAGASAAEEGVQETAEGLASDIAIKNVAQGKELGEDSAANFILGAIGGAPAGGLHGLKTALVDKYTQGQPPPPPAGQTQTQTQVGANVEQAATEPAPGVPGIDPARVEQLTQTFIDQGLDPGRAQYRAVEVATREAEDQAEEQAALTATPDVSKWTDANLTQTLQLQEAKSEDTRNQPLVEAVQAEIQKRAATQGAENVGQTITEPSGAGVSVAGQPDTNAPAAGVGITEPSGVVSTGQDVAGVVGGETTQPTTVEATTETELTPEEQATIQEELAAEQAKTDDVVAEEAPIPDSVADVVGDLTTLPEEETPAEAAAKGKRGRKPLTPEQKAASDERRKQQRTNYKENVKAVDAAEAALNEALAPIDEETVGGEKSLASAQEDKRIGKIQAIKSLLLLARALKGTKLGDRAAALLNNPAIKPAEIENVKKGIAAQVSKANTQVKVGRADGRFSDMTTGQQALRHVIKTGNAFQRFLAQRLLPFVKDVNFKVIEEDDVLPSQITEGGATEDWEASRGLFLRVVATGERFVFVRGISGGPSQGINNVTVLHEMLHAALNKKMDLALDALQSGFDRRSDLAVAYNALLKTMNLVVNRVNEMREAGTLPDFMNDLIVSGKIFEDPREFIAYAMSDPRFQKFLMETAGHIKQSLFTRFVNNVRQFFGMDASHTSALSDVINLTDKMITARKTPLMRMSEAEEQLSGKMAQVSSATKNTKQKVNATIQKIERGTFADTIREMPTLFGLRDQQTFLDVLNSSWVAFDNFKLQQLLPALQTETLVQWADRLGIKGIKEAWQHIGDMAAMRNSLTRKMFPVSDAITKLAAKSPEQFRRLASVMHYSTLLYRDPTKPFYLIAGTGSKREHHSFATKAERDAFIQANNAHLQTLGNMRVIEDTDLEKLWNGLTDANKKLYEQARDFFQDNHELYNQLLEEQIAQSKLAGTAGNTNSPKGKLIAQIKQMYEEGKKLYPYFPLMRYGQYWIRIGKGPQREFYMFENAFDRNMFLRQRFRQLQKAGETRSIKTMLEDQAIDMGNDLSDARKKMEADASGLVKEIFNAIDDGAKNGTMDVKAVEELKDQIYQMYLQTLPDRNFRRQFMHRQGTTGFTGDIGRNFITAGTNMANQLARIKYGPQAMAQIERAKDLLAGNPDKAKLGEFVTEMRLRAEQQIRPSSEDSMAFAASNLLNQGAYLWLMTSFKTAIAQMTAIPIFAAPVLMSNHGLNPFRVAKAMTKSMAIFGTTGIKRTADDGTVSWEFPSMLNNQLVQLTGDRKLAAQYMLDRGISESTQANDLMNRRGISSQEATSTARRVLGATATVMTGLFHHVERMVREVTFMSSYDMYREDINKETGKKYTHEEALRAAEAETHEALNNYHAANRPRGLIANAERQVLINAHKPSGRALLQFKMFPAFVTTFFVRNAYRMMAGMDAQDRKKAMAQLFGSLTMSAALAGYVGVPGASMLMGVIQGLMNAIRSMGGDDDDDPLEERDVETWFRDKWMPQTFGNVKIGDHTLDEILNHGLIATMTGYDISSSLSMNNMWFPDTKEMPSAAAAVQDYMLSMMGPGASLAIKQIPQAIDYFNKGQVMRGLEQLSPAFVRGAFTAARYEKEGATTAAGLVIKDPEEFTKGQLWAQRFGFATEGLVARREAIFALQGEILKVKQERAKLLARLDERIDKGDDEDVENTLDKIAKFNGRNPFDPILAKNIESSMKKYQERKRKSDRGVPIDKKYYPQIADLLEPSNKALERESALNKK